MELDPFKGCYMTDNIFKLNLPKLTIKMTICYEEFIIAKFISITIPIIVVHFLLTKLILSKKITNIKQLWIINIILFIVYAYIGYSISFGYENCAGKDGPLLN